MKKGSNKKKAKNKGISLPLVLLILFIVLILSFWFDLAIVKSVNTLRNPILDALMLWITFLGSTISVLFILTSLFMWHERKRRWIIPLWASLLFSFIITSIFKFFIARPRPYQLGIATLSILKSSFSLDSSFPSLHAAAAFSALPVLDKEFPRFKFVWLGFALLVAFSRIYFALHYLSDLLIGAFIGYSIGCLAVRLEEKYKYSNLKRIIRRKRLK